MIRDILLYLTTPLTGPLGAAWIHAARSESARADAAELNEALARGRAEHADETTAAAYRAHAALVHEIHVGDVERERMAREIETLRSEAASAADEDAQSFARHDLESVKAELGRAEIRIGQLTRERDELQRRLDSRGVAAPAEAKPELWPHPGVRAVDACAWCGAEGTGWFNDDVMVCTLHGKVGVPTWDDIDARIKARAASCPARQVADPLAIDCETCLARKGTGCNGSPCDMTAY